MAGDSFTTDRSIPELGDRQALDVSQNQLDLAKESDHNLKKLLRYFGNQVLNAAKSEQRVYFHEGRLFTGVPMPSDDASSRARSRRRPRPPRNNVPPVDPWAEERVRLNREIKSLNRSKRALQRSIQKYERQMTIKDKEILILKPPVVDEDFGEDDGGNYYDDQLKPTEDAVEKGNEMDKAVHVVVKEKQLEDDDHDPVFGEESDDRGYQDKGQDKGEGEVGGEKRFKLKVRDKDAIDKKLAATSDAKETKRAEDSLLDDQHDKEEETKRAEDSLLDDQQDKEEEGGGEKKVGDKYKATDADIQRQLIEGAVEKQGAGKNKDKKESKRQKPKTVEKRTGKEIADEKQSLLKMKMKKWENWESTNMKEKYKTLEQYAGGYFLHIGTVVYALTKMPIPRQPVPLSSLIMGGSRIAHSHFRTKVNPDDFEIKIVNDFLPERFKLFLTSDGSEAYFSDDVAKTFDDFVADSDHVAKTLDDFVAENEGKMPLLRYPSRDDPESDNVLVSDLESLKPGEYLNSAIMNFYIRYLQKRIPVSVRRKCDIHPFTTYFYEKLKGVFTKDDGVVSFTNLRRWWKGVNIFLKTFIFLPIHENYHWSLVIIYIPKRKAESGPIIYHLDSLGDQKITIHRSETIFQNVQRFLIEERDFLGRENVPPQTYRPITGKKIEVPQQDNGCDCGLFALYFMERFIEEAPIQLESRDLKFGRQWFRPEEASRLRSEILHLLRQEFTKAIKDGSINFI